MNNLILNILPIFMIATPCVAIDITSFKRIPHSGHGEAVLKEKALRTSITAEQRRDVPTQPAEVDEANSGEISSLFLEMGYGLTRKIDLHLGLRAIEEATSQYQESGFSMARLAMRYHIGSLGKFSFVGGAFYESQAVADGTNTIAKATTQRPGGFLDILIGNRYINAKLDLGMRDRQPENWALYYYGTEYLIGSEINYNHKSGFGGFINRDMRMIFIREVGISTASPRLATKSEMRGGIRYVKGKLSASLYGGLANESQAYGYGAQHLGFSMSMKLGAGKANSKTNPKYSDAGPRNHGHEILDDLDDVLKQQKPKTEAGKVMDDFSLSDQELKRSGLKESLKDQDQYADEQIQKLQEVEAKKKNLQNEEQGKQNQYRRQSRKERLAREAAEKRLSDEIDEELKGLPVVTDDEANWRGLEKFE